MFLILIFGYFGLQSLQSRFFPKTPENTIKIQVAYPGASPEEMEEGVVLRIEENLEGTTGVERVRSVSSENTADITVELLSGYDADEILQDVKNAVDQINSFPANMEKPVIFVQENRNLAYTFALSGNVSLKALKDFGRRVEDDLRKQEFISKVSLSGFPAEEIEIAFRDDDLQAYSLTFEEATQAVAAANIDLTGGKVKGSREELLVRARNKGYYADELRNIIVKNTPTGGVLRLYQVADVNDKWSDSPNRTFMNGKTSVVVTVNNTDEEDILKVTSFVADYIDKFNEENEIVKATTISDRSVSLRQRIDLLVENGIVGFFLVLLFLALFLNWELAFWVALAIPVSFAGMFILAGILGVTINVISLFGMIIVVGILVDDGIVIAENIYQHYERGKGRLQAAVDGTMEVLPAVFSAILTTAVAFSAFFFIEGRLGDFFSEMAIVVIITLAFSLIEGILILPAHVSHSSALNPDNKENIVTRSFDRLMRFLRDKFYAPILAFSIRNVQRIIPLVLLIGGLILVVAAIRGGHIGTTFFPFIERDNIDVTLKMPAGTREHIVSKHLEHIEEAVWKVNEAYKKNREDGKDVIEGVQRTIGPTTYQGSLSINLLDGDTRSIPVLEITDSIKNVAGEIVGVESLSYGGVSVFGKPISVSLLGNNLKQLESAVEELKVRLSEVEGLKDVIDNNQEGLREINIQLKDKARQLGLNLQQVVGQVRRGFFGSEVQRLQRGEDEVKVWVRYGEEARTNLGQLENMRIRVGQDESYPLSELAVFSIERGVVGINHIDGKREIKVEADITNKDVSVSDITEKVKTQMVPDILKNYPGVAVLYEGQDRQQRKTSDSIAFIGPIVLLLMFSIMALTFRSISQALAVFLLIPFGFIGVGIGHYFLDSPISLFSGLGIIALIGIMVNDGLVFVAAYNSLIEEGKEQMEAIYEAGLSRFRPIVLTSLTTALGLGPLILETSFQAQFLIPMAISVAFGLLVVTVIILILLPIFLIFMNRIKYYGLWAWSGEQPALENVEPHAPDRKNYNFLYYFTVVVVLAGFLLSYFG